MFLQLLKVPGSPWTSRNLKVIIALHQCFEINSHLWEVILNSGWSCNIFFVFTAVESEPIAGVSTTLQREGKCATGLFN